MTARIGNLPLQQSLLEHSPEFPVEEASIPFSAGATAPGGMFGNFFGLLALWVRGHPVRGSGAG
jgi:hypothetical protein